MHARVRGTIVEYFNNALEEVGLLEIQGLSEITTWSNRVIGEGRISSKIDRAMCNNDF